jgi:hypothetical protein
MRQLSFTPVFIMAFLFSGFSLYSQSNLSIRLSTLSYQLSEAQPELVRFKFDQDGKLAFDPGIAISYEAYATGNTALKLNQAFIYDKAAHLAGISQVMIKFRIAKSFKHSFHLGIGPVVHYRKSWADMDNYIDEPIYTTKGDWQYKLSWLSGELEYNYYLNKSTDLSVSFNHIQAESIGILVGLKYWISRKPVKKKGCVSCPGLR